MRKAGGVGGQVGGGCPPPGLSPSEEAFRVDLKESGPVGRFSTPPASSGGSLGWGGDGEDGTGGTRQGWGGWSWGDVGGQGGWSWGTQVGGQRRGWGRATLTCRGEGAKPRRLGAALHPAAVGAARPPQRQPRRVPECRDGDTREGTAAIAAGTPLLAPAGVPNQSPCPLVTTLWVPVPP